MLRVSKMAKRRKFTKQFKDDVVRLINEGGKSVAEVCQDHNLYDSSVYEWLRQAEIDAGEGPAGALTSAEREELARLRKQVRELEMERAFLKKAAAFFAKESK
jgi:transposase